MKTWTRIALALLLIDFTALLGYAVWTHGYIGVFEAMGDSPAALLFAIDSFIALGLGLVWMVQDARRRGASSAPFVLLTLATGCPGILLYLIRRKAAPVAA